MNFKQIPNISKHRLDIQGLRAIAIIMVFFYHLEIPFFKMGYLGVDIFFVISGFVITKMLFLEYKKNLNISFVKFYIKRFKRLYPALAVCVTIVSILSIFILSPLKAVSYNSLITGLSSLYGLSNVVAAIKTGNYFDPSSKLNIFINTWSLAVEEQFYTFFLIILFLLFIKKISNLIFVSIFFISLILFFINSADLISNQYIYTITGFYSPLPRAWEFFSGVLCFFFLQKYSFKINYILYNMLIYIGFFLIFLSFFDINNFFLQTVMSIFGVSGILIGGGAQNLKKSNFFLKIISNNFFLYIGNISYSLYLWHWPVIIFFTMYFELSLINLIIVIFISLIISMLSYHFIENPFRRLFYPKKIFKIILIALIVPTTILLFLLIANSYSYWSSAILNFKTSVDPYHLGNTSGCGQGFVPNDFNTKKCLWNSSGKNTPIYLIGDSNAEQFSEALIISASKLDSPVRIFTKGGCSLIGKYWSNQSYLFESNCNNYVEKSIYFLKESSPGIVFIGLSDSIWNAPKNDNIYVGPNKSDANNNVIIIHEYLLKDLIFKINEIKERGHKIILIQPVPKFIDNNNRVLFDYSKTSAISIFRKTYPETIIKISDVDEQQHDSKDAIRHAANITKSDIIDLKSFFCNEEICKNIDNNFYLYRDAGHISVEQSIKFSELFENKIKKLIINK